MRVDATLKFARWDGEPWFAHWSFEAEHAEKQQTHCLNAVAPFQGGAEWLQLSTSGEPWVPVHITRCRVGVKLRELPGLVSDRKRRYVQLTCNPGDQVEVLFVVPPSPVLGNRWAVRVDRAERTSINELREVARAMATILDRETP